MGVESLKLLKTPPSRDPLVGKEAGYTPLQTAPTSRQGRFKSGSYKMSAEVLQMLTRSKVRGTLEPESILFHHPWPSCTDSIPTASGAPPDLIPPLAPHPRAEAHPRPGNSPRRRHQGDPKSSEACEAAELLDPRT